MATTLPSNREPTHPGEMLNAEFIEPLNLTQTDVARRLGISFPRLNEIINRKRAVTPDTAPIDGGEVILQLRPLLRHSLVCEDGQRGLKVRDRGLLVVGALAANALPVGDAQCIVGRCPVLGVGFARPSRQRGLQESDGLFLIVGEHAPRAGDVKGADAR